MDIEFGRAVADSTPPDVETLVAQQRVDIVTVDEDGLLELIWLLDGRFDISVAAEALSISLPAPRDVADLAKIATIVRDAGIVVAELALRRPTRDEACLSRA